MEGGPLQKSRHAYLILAHKNPGQLRKLIELLDDSRNDIYVHVDAKNKDIREEDFKDSCRYSRLSFASSRIRVSWGGVSIMRAELALLKAAIQKGGYAYYHLLSGMDLPIKTQDEIHDFFERNAGNEFLNYWPMKKSALSRFRYYTVFPEGESKFRTRIVNHIFKGLQMAVGYRINRGIDFRIASQWFSITDSLARYVVQNEEWLEKVFRRTSTCDEIFRATLVWNSPYREKLYQGGQLQDQRGGAQANMRFIDWTRGESVRHPWTFTIDDYDLLQSVPHLWARKFDESVDGAIIEKIHKKLKM